MASAGFPPGLVLYPEQPNSKLFKDNILPFLPSPGSRHDKSRSSIIASHEQNDVLNLRSGLHGYNQFINYLAMRRMSLPAEFQDMHDGSVLSSFGIDEQWTNREEFLEFLMTSRSRQSKEDCLGSSEFRELQAFPTDHAHLKDIACFGAKESLGHTNAYSYNQEADYDFLHHAPYPSMGLHSQGRLSLVDTMADMKDLSSALAEFAVIKDSAQFTKQQVLVPHFTWSDAMDLQDHVHTSSVILETVTFSPLKSPEKVQRKSAAKRKTKKTATRERNMYSRRNNNCSLHVFETIISLMVDKKRNVKSVMKSSPEVPQLLTHFSASITGTGLVVIFSVACKVTCGTLPFCTSNILTTAFGVGLFWLSRAVNTLRNTIIYIRKNFSKIGLEEEEMMMTRVDQSVKDIVFRAAALMGVFMLRFA